ncbi:MAG: ABC transporter permease [Myxococcales bacterium]|nr:ABC transporter permease [Myxococcales bacterium]MCB9544854.1 ABC transporter permease [Myxococcales bacterium]
MMTPIAADAATVGVLWRRDLLRFVRQRSRLFGALAQPLVFWGIIGGGMASTFKLPGADGLGYMEYFYPGILVMLVLFASIFGTISVIEDRHEGFLQSVLAGPGSRAAVVLGKSLGVSSVGLLQAALFLAFLPFTPFVVGSIDWITLAGMLSLGAVGLTAFGFALAWVIDSTQGYHAVMSILLLPAWILSGAMFPPSDDHPVLQGIMSANPMTYLVSGVRRAFYGQLPGGTTLSAAAWMDWAIVGGFACGAVALATYACYRKR